MCNISHIESGDEAKSFPAGYFVVELQNLLVLQA